MGEKNHTEMHRDHKETQKDYKERHTKKAKCRFVSVSLRVSCSHTRVGDLLDCLIICPWFKGFGNIQSAMHIRALTGSRGSTCWRGKLPVERLSASVPSFHTTQTSSEDEHREARQRIKILTWRQRPPPPPLWLSLVCLFMLAGRWHFTGRVESDSAEVNNCRHHRFGI